MTGLRTGITTGACAAAAAGAAATVLVGRAAPANVVLTLPRGQTLTVPILDAQRASDSEATAAVRKDAGDDPDATHGLTVVVKVSWADGGDVTFAAGEGVGTVTKPGLQIPPGEPAINPVPRQMIRAAVRALTDRPLRVEVSIPGGREVAMRTFNPRLGIVGGLSVLGTTGIVRPYCIQALRAALQCTLDVAAGSGVTAPILVPGNIGAKAASQRLRVIDEQVIHVGNEWGHILDLLPRYPFAAALVAGHPGKLAKFLAGQWDTHSSRSDNPVGPVAALVQEILHRPAADSPTVEGVLLALPDQERRQVGTALAQRIRAAVADRLHHALPVAVYLITMDLTCIGTDGDFSPWQ